MKNFDSRTYSINDFLEWHDKKQLVLSPKFQRRSVWTDNARSYLMDTIVRGKPIPKVFIRQSINVQTRQSIREVVDGQQRLRTILSYLNDGFQISKRHNEKYGGYYFSQLDSVDPDIQSFILNYEISADLLVNMSDSEILDIFSRLNSYSVTLNEQEKINANHFGPFKVLADRISHKYNEFWLENGIINSQNILRMNDVTLVSDLIIAMCEGIQSKKQIKSYYNKYENEFPYDEKLLEKQFDETIEVIQQIFPSGLKSTEFRRIHVFYTLFTSIFHTIFGLKNFERDQKRISPGDYPKARNILEKVELLFQVDDVTQLDVEQIQFLTDSRRATTDTKVRIRRAEYVIDLLNSI
ncbi:DUF262 domain-containing protein [Algoriphagus limi]|uniref:DUF262 domain-containing protein n=1 Tax=Algoriphagus limi TaxID=2975273 RepID=A0ABT2G941_9BACT|nr:DUF262 domain-containing protein [Algoriphagus limi]MCS5491794.1 DUF262 domain-containing protein [Algoriphagus limi]